MGLPVVCTPLATLGLRGTAPVAAATTAGEFAVTLAAAWRDTDGRPARSRAIREWVMREHSWRATAEAGMIALAGHK